MSPLDPKKPTKPASPVPSQPAQSKPAQPFLDEASAFDALSALEPFDGDQDDEPSTRVVQVGAMVPEAVSEDVKRAIEAGVSIATTLIEPLPEGQTALLEFRGNLQSVVVSKSVTVIGRAKGIADVVLPDDGQVSRQHAALIFAKGEFYLEDLNSSNGTLVEGKRIKSIRLKPMQLFQVGSYVARLKVMAKSDF